jgi:hypothetical protein
LLEKEVEVTSALIEVSGANRWTLKDESGHPTSYWAQEPAEAGTIIASATARPTTPTT